MPKNKLILLIIFIACGFLLSSCKKKEEPQQNFIPPPQQENSADLEKQKKEKEEFDRLKQEELNKTKGTKDSVISKKDSLSIVKDTSKTKTKDVKKDNKKFTEKTKELNAKFGNPKTAIKDYLEYIKRGTSGDGSFDKNMKNANEVWVSSSTDKFKNNYKNTKKFVVVTEPELVSQSGNNATVKVKIKKVDKVKNQDVESDLTVTYNMVADKDGKWKIKSNTVKKN